MILEAAHVQKAASAWNSDRIQRGYKEILRGEGQYGGGKMGPGGMWLQRLQPPPRVHLGVTA